MGKTVLVDGSTLAYRNWNALKMLSNSQGEKTGLYFGFVRSLISYVKKYRPDNLIVVWDSIPERKNAAYSEYKANRELTDDKQEMFDCMPILREFLESLGVKQVKIVGEEADDIIATLVQQGEGTFLVIGNDTDYLQLVPKAQVLMTGSNKIYDEKQVQKEWGCSQDALVVLRSFLGEVSDNLPGIKGFPPEKVSYYVDNSVSINEFYDRLMTLPVEDQVKEQFLEFRKTAELNFSLAKLGGLDKIEILTPTFSKEKFISFCERWEMKSFLKDVGLMLSYFTFSS